MGIVTTSRVWAHSKHVGTEKLMLLAVADHVSDETGKAWPAVATLAKKCGVSERQAVRLLNALQRSGELIVAKKLGSKWGTNLYRISIDAEAAAPRGGDIHVTTPGDIHVTPGGDARVTTPLTPVSPKPSMNHHDEPSVEPPEGRSRAVSVRDLVLSGIDGECAQELLAQHSARGRKVLMCDELATFVAEVAKVPGLTVQEAGYSLACSGSYLPGFRSEHAASCGSAHGAPHLHQPASSSQMATGLAALEAMRLQSDLAEAGDRVEGQIVEASA